MATAPSLQIYGPPQAVTPLDDEAWRRWLTEVVWPLIGAGVTGSGNQGTFPQLQIGKARFTSPNAFQELLSVDQGLYVNYSATDNNIIYGYACNVHRSGGAPFVVAAQLNSWIDAKGCSGIFGMVTQVVSAPFLDSMPMVGAEIDVGNQTSTHEAAKWGLDIVFKDRTGATPAEGLGSNFFNYYAEAVVLSAQARSGAGEFCGWNCGVDFLDGSLDASSVPAWSATTTYSAGMIVSSGGTTFKAIQTSLNQLPAAVSAYWVQHGVAASTANLAVGIDFSSTSTTGMGRIASAIRLRNTMLVHWEESGAIGTAMDANNAILRLCDNQGTMKFGVKVATGITTSSQAVIAPGGGAGATLPTIGGTGPAAAASKGWVQFIFNGATYFIPVWQ